MKINLDFFLRKNHISLLDFCKINNLSSYKALVDYCNSKNMICVKETFYNESIPSNIENEDQKSVKEKPSEKSEPELQKGTTKRRGASKAPKVAKKRTSRSKSTS